MRFLKTVIFTGVPFGVVMSVFFFFRQGDATGVVVGLACGVLFGLALAVFVEIQHARFLGNNPCAPGEQIIKQGPANHFRGESVGGWLYLTTNRVIFKPHNFNAQTQEVSIPIREITGAEPCNSLWIIPNGLRITTTKQSERFAVSERDDWINALKTRSV